MINKVNKEIKFILDTENKKIIIEDDNVVKGDYISLDKQWTLIESLAKQYADEHYKIQIISEYKNSEAYKKLLEDKTSFQNKFNDLNSKINEIENNAINNFKSSQEYLTLFSNSNNFKKLESELETIKLNAINDFKLSSEYKKLELHNRELINDLKNLENKLEDKNRIIKHEIIEQYKDTHEYKELLNQVDKLKEEKIKLQTNYESKIENSYYVSVEKFKKSEEYIKLQNERDTLKDQLNSRRYKNSKLLGEDLEDECQRMFENDFQQLNDVKFIKTTKPINGFKPDFEFIVFSNEKQTHKLGSIILEMKNNNGEDKKKNSDFLEKLEKDRINFHADFALLVTELEANDNFTIKKAVGYSNIFLVRPEQFIYVLILFRLIYINLGKAMDDISKERLSKAEIDNIIQKFSEFKNNLFNVSLEKIEKNIQDIIKFSEDIKKKSEDIIKCAEVIKNTHLETVKNKIADFNKKMGN